MPICVPISLSKTAAKWTAKSVHKIRRKKTAETGRETRDLSTKCDFKSGFQNGKNAVYKKRFGRGTWCAELVLKMAGIFGALIGALIGALLRGWGGAESH